MTTTFVGVLRRHKAPHGRSASFRPDLEGMRAVAVLVVFADHLFGWPTGGFVGVDIFFVLSGFFITGLLLRERTDTGTVSFRNFYVRRVRRIIPASLLVLAATAIVAYIVFPATRAKETIIDALWASVFAANWRFEKVGTDYFQEGLPPSPVQHYWSLSIEEQFYFVWPVLLVGLFWATRRAHRSGRKSLRQGALAAAMLAIVAASFVWAMMQSASEPGSAYFSTFTRVWELGVGALLAIAGSVLTKIPNSVRPALAYVGLAGVVTSLFVITSETQFPGPGAALPVLSTALVVAAFHGAPVRAVPMLTNPVAVYFGRTSYSLYLWHWPVIVVLAAIMPENTLYFVVAAALALVLSHLSFTFVEDPIRKSKWLERDTVVMRNKEELLRVTPASWSAVGFVTAAAVIGGLLTIQLDARTSRTGETNERLVVAATSGTSTPVIDPCFGAAALFNAGQECALLDTDALRPSVDGFTKDTQGAFSCWRAKTGALKPCSYGPTGQGAVRIALVGDSHAASLMPGLSTQLFSRNWNLTTYLGDGCRWVLNLEGNCAGEIEKVHEEFMSGKYDVILTTASRRFGGLSTAGLVDKIVETWRPVIDSGTRIVAVGDNPTVNEDVIRCLTRFGADALELSACGASKAEATSVPDPILLAAYQSPQVGRVDTTDLFCSGDWCPAIIGRAIVYRDTGGHTTATYQKSMATMLADRIDQQVSKG